MLCMSHRGDAYWVNLGDSRIYKYTTKFLQQLTVDDTVAGQLSREPGDYQGRNELLQFVGIGPVAEPHVGRDVDPTEPTVYLMSSDGIHFLPSKMLHQINQNANEPAVAAKRMMDLAIWCGGHDNASLIVGEFSSEILDTMPPMQFDSLEAWDAFGDARFFGVRSLIDDPLLNRSAPTEEKIVENKKSHYDESSVEYKAHSSDSVLALTPKSVKRESAVKISGKRKKSLRKVSEATAPKDEKSTDVPPQLTIHFRRNE
jgi:hypothetical protein